LRRRDPAVEATTQGFAQYAPSGGKTVQVGEAKWAYWD
jgi:hypothetical protein